MISFLVAILSASKAQTWYQKHRQNALIIDNDNDLTLPDGIPLKNCDLGNYTDNTLGNDGIIQLQVQVEDNMCIDSQDDVKSKAQSRDVRLGLEVG